MKPVQVKICGITQKDQALDIVSLGADALGFILYPPSKRYIDPDAIKAIIQALPPYTKTVGVVVNESLENLEYLYKKSGLDMMQLHGEENVDYAKAASEKNIHWMKAFRVKADFDFSVLKTWPTQNFLLDAWDDNEYGGTGKTLDWQTLKDVCRKHQVILAGGLKPENIQTAIQTCEPAGIDLSSGVETSPGIKDLEKVKELMQRLLPNIH